MLSGKHYMALPTLFLTLISIALICFIHGKNKPKRTNKLLPPGPKPWPLVGSLLVMLRNKPTFRWIHKLMSELNTEIMCVRLGNVHVITVISPEIAVEFLKTQDAAFSSRPLCMSASLTSGGYLTTALTPLGEQWKKMRRIVSSEILSQAKHHWLLGKRDEEADHLLRYVYNLSKNSTSGGIVNVRYIAQHYCGNLIRKLMFGKRFFGEGQEDGGPGVEEEEHVKGLFTILEYLYSFCVSDYLPWLRGVVDLDGHETIMRKALSSVRKYQDTEIDKRVKLWMFGTRKEAEDLLDVLILLREADGSPSLSVEEIKAQTAELMIATVDNPSNAAEGALAEMINQPETLERAVEELDTVIGKDRLVQESDLWRLNYVKSCIKESFRLHPIAPLNVPHVSITDTTIAGYFIPKGSHVLLSRPGLGRNPRAWDEPLEFRPERHLKADGSNLNVFIDGIDTSSITTEWAMTELARNPRVMKKLQAEIRNCVGRKPKVDESDLEKLQYLKMVVKETFRLRPPSIFLVPRETIRHCKIGGYDVYPKTRIWVNVWAIGRDPETWENPDEFYPERFEDSEVDFRGNNFELLPFGAGRRICPGITMGVLVIELTLANLLHCFDWELPVGMKREDISIEEEAGITVHKKLPSLSGACQI